MFSGRIQVGAVVKEKNDGGQECLLLEQLSDIESRYEASGHRLTAYLERISTDGISCLNSAQFHLVDKAEKIYEFVAGDLRLLFFQASSGKVVVCTHLFLKKSQKTPLSEVSKAISWKKRYDRDGAEWLEELS
ncbi:type II toxin-antitoxin system RelE/ParE family toxin [Aquabacterium sp. CECT 9606]|uniref:type II toxin-antitoxin system RelE/ParE family toxin n=1 Tax=Aquabacterium sp. CECT 9606 TaxID=2845822 RepID=UPI001E61035E|nr:type II toxin-antitoxin system RelE/ParE family toxin [Aquabacterium sp. CECT 9606]